MSDQVAGGAPVQAAARTTKLLSYSRMRAFRKCKRLERYEYVDRYRPTVSALVLRWGSLWHAGLEAWWLAYAAGSPEKALELALAAVAATTRDGQQVDEFDRVECEEMLRAYDARWSGNQDLVVVGVEEWFEAPLINPETMRPSLTWHLGGFIDARAERRGTAQTFRYIVEHKHTGDDIAADKNYWLKLQMDHQLSIYTIGGESLEWPPDGSIYDVARRPAQSPLKATPIEKQKRKADGTLYANLREHDETPAEYGLRLREVMAADPARYFQRREIMRTESQLADFLADAWTESRGMHELHLSGRAPRNPEACWQFGKCPFWECCSTNTHPSEYGDKFRVSKPRIVEQTARAA